MSLNAEWTTFLVALLGALIPVIPLGVGLLRTYIKVVENKMLIEQRPTAGKVEQLFHQKLTEAGLNDDNTRTGSTPRGVVPESLRGASEAPSSGD